MKITNSTPRTYEFAAVKKAKIKSRAARFTWSEEDVVPAK